MRRKFLEDELARPRAAWTICCAHHPLFSNGIAADNGILQRDWGTLFKKHGVDIYLCGHEHNLQHLEVAGWKPSFVLAGGAAAHSHPIIRDSRGPFSRSVYGFVHFSFTPEKVTVYYIGTDGKPLHVFERSKAGEVKVLMTTKSDPAITKPLEVIQGIFDKLHPPKTQPGANPAGGNATGRDSVPERRTRTPPQNPPTMPSAEIKKDRGFQQRRQCLPLAGILCPWRNRSY